MKQIKLRTTDEYKQSFINRGYISMRTNDDWYPNFSNNTVVISPVLPLSDGTFRVCVWGADDCGMEIDCKTHKEATKILNKIKEPVSKFDLKELGMYSA